MAIVQRNVQIKAAARDHGAVERCQPLAGLVSPDDGDQHRCTLPEEGGKLADALIVRRMNGKSLEEGLNNFEALVERQ